jgi:hypothetical protein
LSFAWFLALGFALTAASSDAAVFVLLLLVSDPYFCGRLGIDRGVAWFVMVRTARFQRSWK